MTRIRVRSLFLSVERNAVWKKRRHTQVRLIVRKLYAVTAMDRFDQRYVEVGRASRVIELSDGDVTAVGGGPSITVTRGAYAVPPQVQRSGHTVYVSIGRLWLTLEAP